MKTVSQHHGSDLPDLICLGLSLDRLQVDDLFDPMAGDNVVISPDTFSELVMDEHLAEGLEGDGMVPLLREDMVENLSVPIHPGILAQACNR